MSIHSFFSLLALIIQITVRKQAKERAERETGTPGRETIKFEKGRKEAKTMTVEVALQGPQTRSRQGYNWKSKQSESSTPKH